MSDMTVVNVTSTCWNELQSLSPVLNTKRSKETCLLKLTNNITL